jgi:dipeptidyl-peptidase-4
MTPGTFCRREAGCGSVSLRKLHSEFVTNTMTPLVRTYFLAFNSGESMFKLNYIAVIFIGISVAVSARAFSDDDTEAEREAISRKYYDFPANIEGGRVEPHWMADGNSFWYAEGASETTVIWKVDPVAKSKEPLFSFANTKETVRFSVEKRDFEVDLGSNPVRVAESRSDDARETLKPERDETLSPNGQWAVSIRDHNIWLRSSGDNRRFQITANGVNDYAWDLRHINNAWWSPDNTKMVAMKYDLRNVSPAKLEFARRMAGRWRSDEATITDLFIVDFDSKKQVLVDLGRQPTWIVEVVGWHQSELLFVRMTRNGDSHDLMAANVTTGEVREIVSDTSSQWKGERVTRLDNNRFIWTSERGGWNHLYLYDFQGNLVRQLTHGQFPVDRIITVDADRRWVYFTAHADQRQPYRTQLFRVSLDGNDLSQLAENTGQYFRNSWQEIQFSPSKNYFVCNRSTPAEPAVAELRKADGAFLMKLSESDRESLKKLQWKPPEEFSVKAADGETELYGMLFKPYDFNPEKSYPVIDFIYGGDHISLMERYSTFYPQWGFSQSMAHLGYIVLIMDSRGTPGRSKRFHDVARTNSVRDYVIPDHVAGIKQLARERSYIDMDRIGVSGPSAGGYTAILAMLTAPDVFRVGVSWDFSFGGDDDPLLLKLASNLKGKLLLIYGTRRDSNEDSGQNSNEDMARALIDANRFFDALPIQGADHSLLGSDGKYVNEAVRRYFDEHLK